ncbi:hypothetical protein CDIK_1481 [Cucumispora dikerogammari]|nr:hypothetical protein CDIK_1481 [Cucumispora dikerogammari]
MLYQRQGLTKRILKSIEDKYNQIKHRGIGIPPNEAMNPINQEKVRRFMKRYAEEFNKENNKESLYPGDEILIKNEVKKDKMDLEFKNVGTVINRISNNAYEIKDFKGKALIRVFGQLKKIK